MITLFVKENGVLSLFINIKILVQFMCFYSKICWNIDEASWINDLETLALFMTYVIIFIVSIAKVSFFLWV